MYPIFDEAPSPRVIVDYFVQGGDAAVMAQPRFREGRLNAVRSPFRTAEAFLAVKTFKAFGEKQVHAAYC